MGLLTTYNDANKVTDTALRIQYAVEPDTFKQTGFHGSGGSVETWGTREVIFYRVHRYATKSYSYVGMDEATARACQNAKINQYTRPFSKIIEVEEPIPVVDDEGEVIELSGDTQTQLSVGHTYECRSDIVAQHVDGHMWEVVINVNEDDEKFSYELPTNPASLFTAENQRDYDESSVTEGGAPANEDEGDNGDDSGIQGELVVH